jgi:type I restriction enzyme S subunit
MELKEGYNQTEVGLIPEDWELLSFDDIFSFYSTSNYSKAQMSDDNEVGCIHYGLIHSIKNSTYNLKNGIKYYVSKEQAKYEFVRDGDVIMVDASEDLEGLNKSVEVKGVGENKFISGLHTYLLRDRKYLLVDNFRGLILNSQIVKNQMLQLAVGMKVFGVSKSQIVNVKIPLPPTLEEQKAIATALTDVDNLISNLEAHIAKKKAIKQGAMQQLLTPPHKGGKRLDGFDGEWERKEVQKFINVGRGGSPRPIQDYITNSPDGVNWIKIGDTSKLSKYITSSKEKIIKEGEILSRSVKVGDFLLSNSMSFGRPYILKIDGCIHDGWLVLQDYQDYFDIDFLYYTLMSKDVFDQYLQKASGSGVLNLNKELVKVVELNRPADLKEQKAIAQILSDMDEELEELATKKEKYEHIKQGMMQELLTGKTRLI